MAAYLFCKLVYEEKTVIIILDIFARCISLLLHAVSLAMLLRIFLPFFTDPEESSLYMFLSVITEPFIAPVRFFMVKFNLLQDSPIDWSFTITYLLIGIIQAFLPVLY